MDCKDVDPNLLISFVVDDKTEYTVKTVFVYLILYDVADIIVAGIVILRPRLDKNRVRLYCFFFSVPTFRIRR